MNYFRGAFPVMHFMLREAGIDQLECIAQLQHQPGVDRVHELNLLFTSL
jgi:hypothetical protein